MKHTTFACDLCRRELPPSAVLGVHWQGPGGGAEESPVTRIALKPPHDCNTHLCHACARDIRALLQV